MPSTTAAAVETTAMMTLFHRVDHIQEASKAEMYHLNE